MYMAPFIFLLTMRNYYIVCYEKQPYPITLPPYFPVRTMTPGLNSLYFLLQALCKLMPNNYLSLITSKSIIPVSLWLFRKLQMYFHMQILQKQYILCSTRLQATWAEFVTDSLRCNCCLLLRDLPILWLLLYHSYNPAWWKYFRA